jgi:hypothetical protein
MLAVPHTEIFAYYIILVCEIKKRKRKKKKEKEKKKEKNEKNDEMRTMLHQTQGLGDPLRCPS